MRVPYPKLLVSALPLSCAGLLSFAQPASAQYQIVGAMAEGVISALTAKMTEAAIDHLRTPAPPTYAPPQAPIRTQQPPPPTFSSSSFSPPPGWTNNGRNSQCDGKPKFTVFQCVSPSSGRVVNCVCD